MDGWSEGSLSAFGPRSINYRLLNGSANCSLEHSQRRSERSAHPQKHLNLSCLDRWANGWFETAFIFDDVALALGGSEPKVRNAEI